MRAAFSTSYDKWGNCSNSTEMKGNADVLTRLQKSYGANLVHKLPLFAYSSSLKGLIRQVALQQIAKPISGYLTPVGPADVTVLACAGADLASSACSLA